MSRIIRVVFVALALIGTATTFSACMESPTDVVQDGGYSNDN